MCGQLPAVVSETCGYITTACKNRSAVTAKTKKSTICIQATYKRRKELTGGLYELKSTIVSVQSHLFCHLL